MAFRVSLLIPLTKKSNLSGTISPSIYLPKSFLAFPERIEANRI